MISSLQGEFKNYSVTFENINPLGDPGLSILDELEIHEKQGLDETGVDETGPHRQRGSCNRVWPTYRCNRVSLPLSLTGRRD